MTDANLCNVFIFLVNIRNDDSTSSTPLDDIAVLWHRKFSSDIFTNQSLLNLIELINV